MGSAVQYKVRSSQIISVIFFISYSAGRVCLIPFLTLFFRNLGYTPLEAGIIRGSQTLLTVISIPLLIRCAKACHRWHCVLLVPLIVTVIMYMSLILTPSFNTIHYSNITCGYFDIQLKTTSEKDFNQVLSQTLMPQNTSTENSTSTIATVFNSPAEVTKLAPKSSSLNVAIALNPSVISKDNSVVSKVISSPVNSSSVTVPVANISKPNSQNLIAINASTQFQYDFQSNTSVKSTENDQSQNISPVSNVNNPLMTPFEMVHNLVQNINGQQLLNEKYLSNFNNSSFIPVPNQNIKYLSSDASGDSYYDEYPLYEDNIKSADYLQHQDNGYTIESQGNTLSKRNHQRFSRSISFVKSRKRDLSATKPSLNDVIRNSEKLNSFASSSDEVRTNQPLRMNSSPEISDAILPKKVSNETDEYISKNINNTTLSFYFWITCVIAVIGEAFGASVEISADEAWFRFLDEIDYVEKYKQQYIPSAVGSSVAAFGITAIASNMICQVVSGTNRFAIHCYAFGLVMVFVIILAYFFPVPQQRTLINEKWSRISILRIIFSDMRTILVTFAVIISGASYACLHDYFLWYMEDVGTSEYHLGLAISLAASSEIPVHLGYRWIIKKLTLFGCISLSLFCYSIRFLYYSFMHISWTLIPMQLLHSLSAALMWRVLQVYIDQISSPGTDRKVQNMFRVIYLGLGYVTGTVFSGFLYNLSGPKLLFWVMAAISCIFSVIFLVAQLYLPRLQRRTYSKILFEGLKDGEDRIYHSIGTDSEDEYNDDWLEKAIRKTRQEKRYKT